MDRTGPDNNATPQQMSQDQAKFNQLQDYELNGYPAFQRAEAAAAAARMAEARKTDAETKARQNWVPKSARGAGRKGK